jgi:hypothetical protein
MKRAFRLGNSFWSISHYAGLDIAIGLASLRVCNELCGIRILWEDVT